MWKRIFQEPSIFLVIRYYQSWAYLMMAIHMFWMTSLRKLNNFKDLKFSLWFSSSRVNAPSVNTNPKPMKYWKSTRKCTEIKSMELWEMWKWNKISNNNQKASVKKHGPKIRLKNVNFVKVSKLEAKSSSNTSSSSMKT